MLHCSFSLVAAQLLVKMTSAQQRSECCSATSAAQLLFPLVLWSVAPAKAPRSLKKLKWPKSDSKVTLGGQRPIDSKGPKVSQKRVFGHKNPFLSHFWPFFESIGRRPPRVTFVSLLGHFKCFGLLGGFRWRYWSQHKCHVAGVGFRGVGFRTCYSVFLRDRRLPIKILSWSTLPVASKQLNKDRIRELGSYMFGRPPYYSSNF